MYNASDRKDIRAAEKDARARELAKLDYLKAAMTVPQARHWFHDLLEACHLFDDPFTGDPLREAYLKGERNVGLRLFSDIIAHCPDDYIRMMKEANGRRLEHDTRRNRNADSGTAGERSDSESDGWDDPGQLGDAADHYAPADGDAQ